MADEKGTRTSCKADKPPAFLSSPQCGAKTRKGTPCKAPAMKNGRCRMHGGKSTGPRTVAGLERLKKARTKYGYYSRESKELRGRVSALLKGAKTLAERLEEEIRGAESPVCEECHSARSGALRQ